MSRQRCIDGCDYRYEDWQRVVACEVCVVLRSHKSIQRPRLGTMRICCSPSCYEEASEELGRRAVLA